MNGYKKVRVSFEDSEGNKWDTFSEDFSKEGLERIIEEFTSHRAIASVKLTKTTPEIEIEFGK